MFKKYNNFAPFLNADSGANSGTTTEVDSPVVNQADGVEAGNQSDQPALPELDPLWGNVQLDELGNVSFNDLDPEDGQQVEVINEAEIDSEGTENQSEIESEDFLNQKIKVKSHGEEQEITVKEAKDGWMRQDDYTRKTQEIAYIKKTDKDFQETFGLNGVGLMQHYLQNPEDFYNDFPHMKASQPSLNYQIPRLTPDINNKIQNTVANELKQQIPDFDPQYNEMHRNIMFQKVNELSDVVRNELLNQSIQQQNEQWKQQQAEMEIERKKLAFQTVQNSFQVKLGQDYTNFDKYVGDYLRALPAQNASQITAEMQSSPEGFEKNLNIFLGLYSRYQGQLPPVNQQAPQINIPAPVVQNPPKLETANTNGTAGSVGKPKEQFDYKELRNATFEDQVNIISKNFTLI